MVQLEDTFLIVGGTPCYYNEIGCERETIIEFDPVNLDWIVREERLSQGRWLSFATAVPRDFLCA